MEFDDRCLSSLISDNLYESRVLKVCVIQVLIPIIRIISSCSALLLRSIWSQRVSLSRTCYRPALRNWTMETITAQVRFNHLKLATSFPDDYTVVHVTKINMHVTPVYASSRLSDSQNVFHHKDMLQVCPQELQRPGISVSQGHTQR